MPGQLHAPKPRIRIDGLCVDLRQHEVDRPTAFIAVVSAWDESETVVGEIALDLAPRGQTRKVNARRVPSSDLYRNFRPLLFASRRRHTRFDCDWSSDVCSSD